MAARMAKKTAEKTAAPPTHRAAQAISTRSSIIHFYEWRVRSRRSPSIFHGLLLRSVGAAPRIPPIPLFFLSFRVLSARPVGIFVLDRRFHQLRREVWDSALRSHSGRSSPRPPR